MGMISKNRCLCFIVTTISMLLLLISCGENKVTNCHNLDGTYWKSRDTLGRKGPVSYHDQIGLIRFKRDSICSGQTDRSMAYKCNDKEGNVGGIASFKLEDAGQLTISIMTLHVPFVQITKEEYDLIMEQNKKTRKKIE